MSQQSLEDFLRAVQAVAGPQTPQRQTSFVGDVVGRVGLGQGLLFNFGDELAAAVRASTGGTGTWRQRYDAAVADERAQLEATRQQRPAASLVAEIGGGVLPAAAAVLGTGGLAAPAVAARVAAGQAGVGRQIVAGAARGAGAGAASGAVAGFGAGEGTLDRVDQALEGSLIGGVAGGLLGGALPAAGAYFARRAASDQDQGAMALGAALQRDRVTPEQAAADYAAAQAGRTMPETLPDVLNGNTQLALRNALNSPAEGRREAVQAFEDRRFGQVERIQQAFDEAFAPATQGSTASAYRTVQDLNEQRFAQSRPLYEALDVNTTPIQGAEVTELLSRIPSRIFARTQEIAQVEGRTPAFGVDTPGQARAWTARDLDLLKKSLDYEIDRYTDAVTGKVGPQGASFIPVRNQIVELADRAVPEYRQARSVWAGFSAQSEAVKLGESIFRENRDRLTDRVAQMGDAERRAFILGVRDAISERLSRPLDNNDASRVLLRDPRTRDAVLVALRATYRGDGEAERVLEGLQDMIRREARMAQTDNIALGNQSQTGLLMATRAQQNADVSPALGVAADVVSGAPPQAFLAQLLRSFGRSQDMPLSPAAQGYVLDTLRRDDMPGVTQAMQDVRARIDRMANTDARVDRLGPAGGILAGNIVAPNGRPEPQGQGLLGPPLR